MKVIHILLLIFIFLSVDVCVTVKEDEKNVEEVSFIQSSNNFHFSHSRPLKNVHRIFINPK